MNEEEKKSDGEKPLIREDVIKLIEEHGEPEGLDLSDRNLKGIDLSGELGQLLNLQDINLSGTDLQEADLSRANLGGVDFGSANLRQVNLSGSDLKGAYFIEADLFGAILSGADLRRAYFNEADLSGADLSGAILSGAYFSEANLSDVDFSDADIIQADFTEAILRRSNFRGVHLNASDLTEADLSDADFRGAYLINVNFSRTILSEADLGSATVGWTSFGAVDLSVARGLDTVIHSGPSTIGIDTFQRSKGDIPEDFLRGCGLSPWEIEIIRLYDPALTPGEISEILDVHIFRKRTDGPLYIGGIFISYSHSDSKFVDKLYGELKKSGAVVWLDRHDLVAGSLEKQVARALRIQDIVIVVLSENSIDSDWVEHELEMARKKEKEENRDVLCPVALDDSWKVKVDGDVLWRQLKKKNVLDFSAWKTRKFSNQYGKLLDGIKIYYK